MEGELYVTNVIGVEKVFLIMSEESKEQVKKLNGKEREDRRIK